MVKVGEMVILSGGNLRAGKVDGMFPVKFPLTARCMGWPGLD
jgi:hypothetical protein